MSSKVRIDKLLVDRNLVTTRARAQALIMAGKVLVNDEPVTKSGQLISIDAEVRLKEPEFKYVSRGALKIIKALDHFKINPEGQRCLDVGSSTGGFTQVLLERGAESVDCVDVGTNQLAWSIRNHPRVKVFENTNARYLEPSFFPYRFQLIVMDVSFISIQLIIPALKELLENKGKIIFLFKPQFELGVEAIGKGGIVKDQALAQEKLAELMRWTQSMGFSSLGTTDSPIEGTSGNKEYLGAIELTPLFRS